MPEFRYTDLFVLEGPDSTQFRPLGSEHVSVQSVADQEVLRVAPQALTLLAREAFREVAFFYRERHLAECFAGEKG
ncbi:MAG: fumarate hydratase, partial [Gemmatimonadales bacterium]